jgi:hypothetical protein
MPGLRTSGKGRVSPMPQRSSRNHRNNPYVLDQMFAQVHHSAAGTIWRFRTELAALATAIASAWELATAITLFWALIVLTVSAATIAALPWTRRFITRRAWCVHSRHRIQRVCYETRMHTRSGRIPLVLRITPTQVGERALIWCRAGICADDFEAHASEIAAACLARQARVEASKRWAQLVQLDIVRRDTLGRHHVVRAAVTSLFANRQRPAARDHDTAA